MKIAIIYHARCADGSMSAAIVYDYWKRFNADIHMYPASYPWRLPPLFPADFHRVYVVDFSLNHEDFEAIRRTVVWIDHHKTAIDRSTEDGHADLDGLRVDGKAGCLLTWAFLHGGDTPAPEIVKLIAERDVWGSPPGSGNISERAHMVNAGLAPVGFDDLDSYTSFLHRSDAVEELVARGTGIEMFRLNQVNGWLKSRDVTRVGLYAGYHAVFIAAVGPDGRQADNVADVFPGHLQVWHSTRFMTNGDLFVNIGFRSRDGKTNCGTIAHMSATDAKHRLAIGGGHFGAAGATIPVHTFERLVTIL